MGGTLLKHMSRLTHNILGAIDYASVAEARNTNFEYLHDNLGRTNTLTIRMPCGPYAYPYYVENGSEVRKRLAGRKIYVPTLWPNVLSESDKASTEYIFASNILPLPCDQRYGIDDMKYIVEELKSCTLS